MADPLTRPVVDALRRVRRASGVPLAFGGIVAASSGLRLQHFDGPTVGALDGVSVDMGHGLGGRVVGVNRPMVVDDYLRTPRITHRYNTIIAREGLRAMAAAPVIVDRKPVAVLYGALRTTDPIGDRVLDALAMEARVVEQEIITARARVEVAASDEGEVRDRLTGAYARLRALAVDDERLAAELASIADELLGATGDDVPALTPREQDVLALAALGYPNARIAESLGVGVQTAKGYMRDAMRKVGASSRLEAVVIARRVGLLP